MRGKKLTPKEMDDKIISKILKRIRHIEKDYSQHYIQSACHKYVNSNLEKRKL